jgi:anti-sigma regulatory factor (Ser/Thr protein kinase)
VGSDWRETVIADEIRLTLPADDAFHSVAYLVLGGLAARLNLSFENLEDLELALDALLERANDGGDVTVRVLVEDGELRTIVGPFSSIRAELEEDGNDSLNLGRILSTVCDSVEITDRDGSEWVELTKRLEAMKEGRG